MLKTLLAVLLLLASTSIVKDAHLKIFFAYAVSLDAKTAEVVGEEKDAAIRKALKLCEAKTNEPCRVYLSEKPTSFLAYMCYHIGRKYLYVFKDFGDSYESIRYMASNHFRLKENQCWFFEYWDPLKRRP